MSSAAVQAPPPFTADDYLARARRVVAAASERGLVGRPRDARTRPRLAHRLPAHRDHRAADGARARARPGADAAGARPSSGPTPRRPRARRGMTVVDWADGTDPYAGGRAAAAARRHATAISDSAWAHAPARPADGACPASTYRSLTERLPMLRAVKDADELARLAAAGAAADAAYERDRQGPLRRAAGDRRRRRPRRPAARASGTSRSTSPSSAPGPTAPTRTTRPATG